MTRSITAEMGRSEDANKTAPVTLSDRPVLPRVEGPLFHPYA